MQKLLLRLFQIVLILGISVCLVLIYPVFILGSFLWLRLAIFFSSLQCGGLSGIFVSPVTGISAFLAPDKMFENPNSTLVHLAILDSTPDLETVTSHLQSIYDLPSQEPCAFNPIRRYAKLGYCLEPLWGYLFWKEIPNFDLRNQITFLHNKALNQDNVSGFVESLIRKPFRPGKPLWEVFIVTPVPSEAHPEQRLGTGCFVIFRTHHILLDGMSLIKFWAAADSVGTQGQNPNPTDLGITYGASAPKPRPASWRRFLSRVKIHVKSAYLSNKYLYAPRDNNVLMSIQNYKQFDGHWWCSGLNKIHLERYRGPLRELGFSVTHALLTGYGRGLRKFITENYGVHQLPGKVHIMGSIPRPPHPPEALTNHWAIMRYKADLTRDSVLEQLEYSRTEYKRVVHHIIPKAFEQMHKLGMDRVPYKLYDLVWDTTKSGTLSLSNLPGSTSPQKMFGIPVSDRAVWLPLTRHNSGIGLLMLTYNGWATISITADSGCIKTRKLFNHLNQSIMSEMQFLLDEILQLSQQSVGVDGVEKSGKDDNHNLTSKLNTTPLSCHQEECAILTTAAELHEIKIV